MKRRLRQYFIFSRAERMGLVALASALLLLVAVRGIVHSRNNATVSGALGENLVIAAQQAESEHGTYPVALPEHQDKGYGYSQPLPDTIDINSADSATLVLLVGVGPATSHNILVRRKTKGPFTSVGQLKEVGSFTDGTLKVLGKHLRFAAPKIK
jgi:DNA uptake protein ComE-like DNA-binding protein